MVLPAITLDLALRWLHILSAVMLVGGVLFWRLAVVPASRELGEEARLKFNFALARAWSKWVMVATAILLLSGLINAVRNITRFQFDGPGYHMLVGVKLMVALLIFALAALLTGRTAAADRLRSRLTMWLSISIAIGIVLVVLGGFMKAVDRTPKAPAAVPNQAASQELPVSPTVNGNHG